MPVIPLVTSGSNRTVVDTEEEFQATGGFEGSALLIFNRDKTQLNGIDCNSSYDLRIGPEYRDHRDPDKRETPEKKPIDLFPGGALIIETEESLILPKGMFGYIVPKVTCLHDGVSNTMSKVDPGYNGPLIITLFNLGKNKVPLRRGQKFCSLVVHTVAGGAVLYNKPGKRITGKSVEGTFRKLRDRLEANSAVIGVIGGIAGTLAALVTIIVALLRRG